MSSSSDEDTSGTSDSDSSFDLDDEPTTYEDHVKQINHLESVSDKRIAREKMAQNYPLSEDIWLGWINDEIEAQSPTDFILELHERAVADYHCPRVWLSFCEYVLTNQGHDAARGLFERALTEVGLDITGGAPVWRRYREMECNMLLMRETPEQLDLALKVFVRELSVPLSGMEGGWEDFRSFASEHNRGDAVSTARATYERAHEAFIAREGFEYKVSSAPLDVNNWLEYIAFEEQQQDPHRTRCVYMRAVTACCLSPQLWSQCTDWLSARALTTDALNTARRAVRNVPFSGAAWVALMRALELNPDSDPPRGTQQLPRTPDAVFAHATSLTSLAGADFYSLYMCYAELLVRRWHAVAAGDTAAKKALAEQVQEVLGQGASYIREYAPEADPSCTLERFLANVLSDLFSRVSVARQLWESIVKTHSKEAFMWLGYLDMERKHGTPTQLRPLFKRAVSSVSDFPSVICDAWLLFERVHGTRADYDLAHKRITARMTEIAQEQAEAAAAMQYESTGGSWQQQHQRQQSHHGQQRGGKQRDQQRGAQGRERWQQQQEQDKRSKSKPQAEAKGKQQSAQGAAADRIAPAKKKQQHAQQHQEQQQEQQPPQQPSLPSQQPLGQQHPQLTENKKSEQRGAKRKVDEYSAPSAETTASAAAAATVAPVAMGTEAAAAAAATETVPEAKDEKEVKRVKQDSAAAHREPKFDPKTIFVSNLPRSATAEQLQELFAQSGSVKEIRYGGRARAHGFAYIEFAEERSATDAIMRLNGHKMEGKAISVAICNPPSKQEKERKKAEQAKTKEAKQGETQPQAPPQQQRVLGGGAAGGRLRLIVPRSLAAKKPSVADSTQDATSGSAPQ